MHSVQEQSPDYLASIAVSVAFHPRGVSISEESAIMDSSTPMEIPRAISGVEATRAIERMQCVWNYRANTVINVALGAKMEYEQ